MRDLLETRLAGLGAMARQLLETAAVIGPSFGLETVRSASGRSDEETVAPGQGRLDAARVELERSLALASRLDDASARTAALNNLALVARDAGELDRARDLTEQALAIAPRRATAIARPRSRTTWPTSITRLGAPTRRWRTSSARWRCSRMSAVMSARG